jgi:hypothetical protein
LHQEDKILFSLLKKEIAAKMMQSFPGSNPEISNWKGQEITDFQEDLLGKVNGQLSEKWFYTHIKNDHHSLPRIDALNILSQYAGYQNWHDFRYLKMRNISAALRSEKSLFSQLRIPLVVVPVIVLIFIFIAIINTQNYQFVFIDSDTGEPIIDNNLKVELQPENESPVNLSDAKEGIITIRTSGSHIKIVAGAPYYLTDTVERPLKKFNRTEYIRLKPDYYSLMISYFSRSDVPSWEKRREQLSEIISEDAIFYQMPDKISGNGMAIFNKQEFIDKITMPSSGLRQIEILDCRYLDGKIVILRFRIKPDKK